MKIWNSKRRKKNLLTIIKPHSLGSPRVLTRNFFIYSPHSHLWNFTELLLPTANGYKLSITCYQNFFLSIPSKLLASGPTEILKLVNFNFHFLWILYFQPIPSNFIIWHMINFNLYWGPRYRGKSLIIL